MATSRRRGDGATAIVDAPLGRILFAAGMVFAAFVSIALTATTVLTRSAPMIAARLTLWPAAADARIADRSLSASLPTKGAETLLVMAAGVVRRNPMDVVAVRVIGIVESTLGHPVQALRAFTYAEHLSRRDAGTQVWLIERSVAQGDIPRTLRHYDRAMLTSLSVRPVLLPILVAATGTASVRDALLPRLRQRPLWWRDYVEEQVKSGTDPAAIAQAIMATGLSHVTDDRTGLFPRALGKLAGTGQVRWAAKLDGRVIGTVRNGGFSSIEARPPFDWSTGEQPDLGATIEPRDGAWGNALSIVAPNADGGEVAKQLLVLRPAQYRLELTAGNISPEARVWLTLSCVSPGRAPANLTVLKIPASAGTTPAHSATSVEVPPSCQGEWLQVWASRTSDQPDNLPWIDNVVLTPDG